MGIYTDAEREVLTEIGEPSADDRNLYKTLKQETGIWGWEKALINGQPREVEVSTSGNGSVTFNNRGAAITPGGTAGDVAELKGMLVDGNPATYVKTVLPYNLDHFPPSTDEIELGWMDDTINQDRGAYVDFTSEELHAGASTISLTPPREDIVVIEIDGKAGETRFKFLNSDISKTINEANFDLYRGIGLTESNGAGQVLRIRYVRQAMIYTG